MKTKQKNTIYEFIIRMVAHGFHNGIKNTTTDISVEDALVISHMDDHYVVLAIEAIKYGKRYATESMNDGVQVPVGNIEQWLKWKLKFSTKEELENFKIILLPVKKTKKIIIGQTKTSHGISHIRHNITKHFEKYKDRFFVSADITVLLQHIQDTLGQQQECVILLGTAWKNETKVEDIAQQIKAIDPTLKIYRYCSQHDKSDQDLFEGTVTQFRPDNFVSFCTEQLGVKIENKKTNKN